ncbi:MAG: DJ-1/PfpI family protein [Candidatus Hydrogenedentota bacterium]
MNYVHRSLICAALITAIAPALAHAQQQEKKDVNAASGPLTVGVVLYPGFELLDVFGPVEMFVNIGVERLKMVMVAEKAGNIASGPTKDATGYAGPKAVADYGFEDCPPLDIILVPGGFGTLDELDNEKLLTFLRERSARAQITTSVCSGSALLAKAGLLDEKKATSNKAFYSMLVANGPKTNWVPKARWVEDGNMITSSGVSAGIDMALAVIARLYGNETAEQIAHGTEYVWNKDPHNDPFAVAIK